MDRVRRVTAVQGRRPRGRQQVSRVDFKASVQAWAEKIGYRLKEIHIRPMKRKWASCSTSGRVSFADDLLAKPARFRSEVIVHELLHLKVPNHGKLFRALFSAFLARTRKKKTAKLGTESTDAN
jgi:predicted metal-dependent hydrolase